MHHHLTAVQIILHVILVVNIDIAREPTQIFGRLGTPFCVHTFTNRILHGTEKVYQVVHTSDKNMGGGSVLYYYGRGNQQLSVAQTVHMQGSLIM